MTKLLPCLCSLILAGCNYSEPVETATVAALTIALPATNTHAPVIAAAPAPAPKAAEDVSAREQIGDTWATAPLKDFQIVSEFENLDERNSKAEAKNLTLKEHLASTRKDIWPPDRS